MVLRFIMLSNTINQKESGEMNCAQIECLIEAKLEQKKDFVLVCDIVKELSDEFSVEEFSIWETLRENSSKYLYDVVGYIDGKMMSRINLIYHFRKVVQKVVKTMEKENKYKFDIEEKCQIVENLELLLSQGK